MTNRVAFLCGERSPYGRAHLEPIAECFELKLVVFASTKRWLVFRDKLSLTRGVKEPLSVRALRAVARTPRLYSEYVERRKIERYLRRKQIRYLTVDDANSKAVMEAIRSENVDLVLSAAYPQIFSKPLLDLTPLGAINFHPSLLPKFRGAHPHYWAIAQGQTVTGITAHFMTPAIDQGDIAVQVSFPLDNMYYADLYQRIKVETPGVVRRLAEFLSDQDRSPRSQEHSQSSYYRGETIDDLELLWSELDTAALASRVRAGRAFTRNRGTCLSVTRCDVIRPGHDGRPQHTPGTVLAVDTGRVHVSTRDNGVVALDGFFVVPMWRFPRRSRRVSMPTVGDRLGS